MKIVTLCENFLAPSFGLKASHGLSLYIEYKNNKLLYDVGQNSLYLENAKILGIDIDRCENVIISHGHWDHAGGLELFVKDYDKRKLIIQKNAFQDRIRISEGNEIDIGISKKLSHLKQNAREIVEDFELDKGIWILSNITLSPGYENLEKGLFTRNADKELTEDYFEDELALAFETQKGLFIVSGCSHRGVINIVKQAQKTTGIEEIYAFIGGMHLHFATEGERNNIINDLKKLNIKKIIVGHCTGLDAIVQMKGLFSKETQIIHNYVGYMYEEDFNEI